MASHVFAGIRVGSFDAARPWYERLFGEPSFFPHATEAVWTLTDGGSVYVVEDTAASGRAVVTVFVDDLPVALAEIAARGLEPAEQETYGSGVRKAIFRDPDGNEVGFAGHDVAPSRA